MQTDDLAALTAPLAELLPVAAALIDTEGTVVWVNGHCRELFAWELSMTARPHLSEFLDPSLVGIARETQRQMVDGSMTDRHVHGRLRRCDGTLFEADCRIKVVHLGPDAELAMLATIAPTGESQIDNPFRRALDLQRELICEWSPGGTILFTNTAYREWFGYEESIVGRNIDDYVEWDDGDDRAATIARFTAGERTIVHTRVYSDGRSVEWANTLVRNEDGSVISVLGVGRDTTQRTTMEATLRRNEQRFRTMVTYIADSILLVDGDGTIIHATSAYRSDLGYGPAFWDDSNIFDLLHPDDRPAALAALASLVDRGPLSEARIEVRAQRHDGSYSFLELNGANLLDDPAINAIILTVRNVDHRTRIELELAQRRAESHAAVRQRVDLGALPVGALGVHPDRVDLQYVFHDVLVVGRELAAPGVDMVADDPTPEFRFVRADPIHAREALANLLSSACTRTEKGRIRVHASRGHEPDTVRIQVDDGGSTLWVELPADRGR